MIDFIKKTFLYKTFREIYIRMNKKIHDEKAARNKLFPGKVKLCDLYNARYISRKPIYDFLISHAAHLGGGVLDFGCGSMEYRKILKSADRYTGLDIEGAQANGFIGGEETVYYNGVDIPFENEKFDSILAIEVFEHVERLDEVLNELNRVIKKGGKMLFTVPMNFPLHLEPWDFRRFTKYGIIERLKIAGFEVEEIQASTTFKNTLRRLQIIEIGERKKGMYFKFRCIINNICFALSNHVTDEDKAPIDWMIVCKKI